ncbi:MULTISPECIES: TetR/AcrR family transcriptional regulator [Cytobacillus]|uniref:TetR/AcrR family transcriptional regulator n=1 Tax=Cytobacillus TaxID=2675230 RepID=UPI001CD33143|nr:TetR/AcrR family transcriptional regulator [Cytobacillus kochii]MCA1029062.1 TetR/AcrR family transcriptional regulator [Cytobacillus kochii]MCM3322183.1 TetR/AcrR family transcriptional regulator [Cytobacillus kochii]MCM3342984.1 TetR/AcrR family transcriptional regulator [Cytobacillus kochii]MDM5206804.1 TetR/AcrR family transcriptional regulator [Cytobacillus kochii]
MKEKEKIIIEAAIKLFAKKGYTATSVQDIATDSGISKGAFYLYFKSKEKLLESLLIYYFDQLTEEIMQWDNKNLTAREKFKAQINTTIDMLIQHKDFIITQTREQTIPINESIKELLFTKQIEMNEFYRKSLSSIYGEEMTPYLWDLSQLLDGLFHSYVKILIIDKEIFKPEHVTDYLLNRMDSLAEGLKKEEPLITEAKMNRFLQKFNIFLPNTSPSTTIADIRQQIQECDDKETLEVSLDMIEEETQREYPRLPVIKGMITNFNQYPDLKKQLNDLLQL